MPRAPHFVRGVINLRGKVVPVVDLRLKFGLEAAADSGQTCIIVVEVEHETGLLPIGLVVDEVFEVRDLAVDQIEGTPEFGPTVETAFILGLGKVGQGVVILLEINRVLSAGELVLVDQTAR
ncbi:MAG: purine-binding chemotaxis protein CheW [Armatimonadetes bacterium]|nr:purine-binding chemotaxis protein CheW [Armatimonadota bacterium]